MMKENHMEVCYRKFETLTSVFIKIAWFIEGIPNLLDGTVGRKNATLKPFNRFIHSFLSELIFILLWTGIHHLLFKFPLGCL